MATLRIESIWGVGIGSPHVKTDWQVSKTKEFKDEDLLLNAMNDTENLLVKKALLKDIDGNIYDPYLGSYARARVWFGETASQWNYMNNTSCTGPGIVIDMNPEESVEHKLRLTKGTVTTYNTEERFDAEDDILIFPDGYTPEIQ